MGVAKNTNIVSAHLYKNFVLVCERPRNRFMAICHISIKVHSRAKGRSAVALAAYRAGERFVDGRIGVVHDYRRKPVHHSEIIAPQGAPAWVHDRERLWNAVEASEKRPDAQVCREAELALPVELTCKQQLDLVRKFIGQEFVERGMVADINIHRDNPKNPHAHVLFTMRHIDKDGFGNKNRDWNDRAMLQGWRDQWEVACNRALQRAGHEARIDARSHAERGLDILPTNKIGLANRPPLRERLAQHLRWVAQRLDAHERVLAKNARAILRDPKVALALITYHEATFTRNDIAQWLGTRVSSETFAACQSAVLSSPDIVALKTEEKAERYTTVDMLRSEKSMLALCDELDRRGVRGLHDSDAIVAACTRATLSQEQADAVRYLVRETGDLAMLEGWAGAGKSRLLGVAHARWQAEGRRVVGCALSGQAARVLAESAGLEEGRSIASLQFAWRKNQDRLEQGDVLIVDEAGLVGTRQMEMLLGEVARARAKLVLVGDGEQLQAVEAGAPFRAMARLVGRVEVQGIRRQQEAWMREASASFAQGHTAAGLAAYAKHGCIVSHDSEATTVGSITDAYLAHEATSAPHTQVVLAYKREHVEALNLAIQTARREAGHVAGQTMIETDKGTLRLGVGDRVMLTKNHRRLGVQNGSLGTVEGFGLSRLLVRTDAGTRLDLDLMKYNHLALGYAMTVHKSQGVTVDRSHVMASRAFDRHATYVAMTRHKSHVRMYFDRESFRDLGMLQKMLGRQRLKSLALDFDVAEQQARGVLAPVVEKARHEGLSGERPIAPAVAAPPSVAPAKLGAAAVPLPQPHALASQKAKALAEQLALAQERLREIDRLRRAERPTLTGLIRALPEMLPVREALRAAAQRRDYFQAALDAGNKHWSRRVGLQSIKAPDPDTHQSVDVKKALQASQSDLAVAAEAFQQLEKSPESIARGRSLLEAHRASEARLLDDRATALENRNELQKLFFDAFADKSRLEKALERERGAERGREDGFGLERD